MMKYFLILVIALTTLPASAAEHTLGRNEWLYISVSIPEAKIGGGDFYAFKVEPGADSTLEYSVENDGFWVRSEIPGRYQIQLAVNHIRKSSCASAGVDTHRSDKINFNVTE